MSRKAFPHPYYFSLKKRLLDVVLSSILLCVLSPVFLVISILIKLSSKGPVIFKQERTGLNGKTFTIYKFRTMYVGADKDQNKFKSLNISPFPTFKIPNDPRFVGIGKWLSRLSLDELPQLLNILKGNMSFVGPRPLPINEAKNVPKTWQFRNLVKPGLISSTVMKDRNKMTPKNWEMYDRNDLTYSGVLNDINFLFCLVYFISASLLHQIAALVSLIHGRLPSQFGRNNSISS